MSKYSVVFKGENLDFRFKKIRPSTYHFYIGKYIIGYITKIFKSWSAVSLTSYINLKAHYTRTVNGFRTRIQAAEFLLEVNDIGIPKEELLCN